MPLCFGLNSDLDEHECAHDKALVRRQSLRQGPLGGRHRRGSSLGIALKLAGMQRRHRVGPGNMDRGYYPVIRPDPAVHRNAASLAYLICRWLRQGCTIVFKSGGRLGIQREARRAPKLPVT